MASLWLNQSFLRLVGGRLITNAGDSVYAVAALWLVWELTGSSTFTGIAGFLFFGTQPLQFLVGPLVDGWDLRRVLIGTQAIQAIGVLAIPVAAVLGMLNVWIVLAVIPVLGMVNQFVYPAQNAALPQIVDEDELVSANSVLSLVYQGVDIVFNALSGVVVAVAGAVALYAVDAVTFAVAALLFAGVRISGAAGSADSADTGDESSTGEAGSVFDVFGDAFDGYFDELRTGADYLRGTVLLDIIFGGMVLNFGFGMMMAVLPPFAETLGGSEFYGFLMASLAAGMLLGAVAAGQFESVPLGWLYAVGFGVSGLLLVMAIVVGNRWLTLGLFSLAFLPSGVVQVLSSSVVQSAVENGMIARVSSVQTSLSTSMMPVGSFVGGTLAGFTSPGTVLVGFGGVTILAAGYFGLRGRVRTLPDVTEIEGSDLDLRPPDADPESDRPGEIGA